MAALTKALEMRDTAREIGGMVRGIQDFLTPCQAGAKRSKSTGRCPEEEEDDDDNS